ncbi:MAG TPA: PPC domain-containing DNA-binding protein [Segeticoccus sp.]|uniref:PPC domain-containing DNA-binding protein n=1 Tax=Segeticoccus sp. TaxID=2706531 RepID=UPI002D7E8518|nr:PPC domain-containing DNA-binding protein [Segeticoccus sp.]HET8600299.1 PPC domain-containing DNA-binding protein [Segeticoccus sp.]
MKWRRLDDDSATGTATYVAVGEVGDEAMASLKELITREGLDAAQVTAVGAFQRAVVGWFDRAAKDYRRIPIDQQCEVLSLVGDVAVSDAGPQLHLHAVLGLPDGTTRGGHLIEGHVWPTLEVILRESPAQLRKTSRPEIGLALIDLDESDT